MARKTITTLTDDLDGGPADETVRFALDGRSWEIDLSVAPSPGVAPRGVRRSTGRTEPLRGNRAQTDQAQNARIRAWGRVNGWPALSDRGRLPDEVRLAYAAATAGATA